MTPAFRVPCSIAFAIVIAASCLATATACAEPFSLSIHSGRSVPDGNLSDAVDDGYYIGLAASQPLIHDQANVELELNYHVLGTGRSQPFFFDDWTIRESVRITETALGIRVPFVRPRARVSPYFKLAVALDFVEPKVVIDTPSQAIVMTDPKYRPGGIGAVGASVRIGASTGLRLEAAYHVSESDPKELDFHTFGLTLWSGIGR